MQRSPTRLNGSIKARPPADAAPVDWNGSPREALPLGRAALRLLLILGLVSMMLSLWSWTNVRNYAFPDERGSTGASGVPALRTVAVETDLAMSSQDESTWILSYGFDIPEPDGTWIVAHHAQLLFNVKNGSPRQVTLALYPFLSGEITTREVEVSSSSEVTSVALVDGINMVAVALDGRQEQTVKIRCSRVESPLELGVGSDQRTLCAKLINVRIGSD